VVLVLRAQAGRPLDAPVVEHFVVERSGRWGLPLPPGEYAVAAYQDVDANGLCDDEPFLPAAAGARFLLGAFERVEDADLLIAPDGRYRRDPGTPDIRRLHARTPAEQETLSLEQCAVLGEVTTLDDARFQTPIGRMGLWRRLDFTLTQRPGIWFLESYQHDRIPVLFVHGITGHPREFAQIVAHLDRARYQPWFYFYPSGASLDALGRVLARQLARLQDEHGFHELAVVAHSMGGLVARAGILEYDALTQRRDIRVFVSISTPFGGDEFAARGAADAPAFLAVPPSFRDLAAGSTFLEGLYFHDPRTRRLPRRLPPHVAHHLLYGYDNGGSGASGDGVLTLASMLRREAQEEARTLRAVNATHTGILRDEETLLFLHQTLASALR
jgi:pimeloyl-ACP methyl ester carboxylesterase